MQPLANFREHRIDRLWRDRVENVPDLIHAGDLVHAKQRLRIIFSIGFLHAHLVI